VASDFADLVKEPIPDGCRFAQPSLHIRLGGFLGIGVKDEQLHLKKHARRGRCEFVGGIQLPLSQTLNSVTAELKEPRDASAQGASNQSDERGPHARAG